MLTCSFYPHTHISNTHTWRVVLFRHTALTTGMNQMYCICAWHYLTSSTIHFFRPLARWFYVDKRQNVSKKATLFCTKKKSIEPPRTLIKMIFGFLLLYSMCCYCTYNIWKTQLDANYSMWGLVNSDSGKYWRSQTDDISAIVLSKVLSWDTIAKNEEEEEEKQSVPHVTYSC